MKNRTMKKAKKASSKTPRNSKRRVSGKKKTTTRKTGMKRTTARKWGRTTKTKMKRKVAKRTMMKGVKNYKFSTYRTMRRKAA